MSDEAFHEIQLNGKQLVFLFMAATVVSVVIFLCGVMVGRGVRAERIADEPAETVAGPAASAGAAAVQDDAAATMGAAAQPPADPAPAPEQAPPAPVEEDYYPRLVEGKAEDTLKPRAEAVPVPSRSAETITPAPKAAPKPPAAAKTAAPRTVPTVPADRRSAEPGTYAVQLVAVRERNEAEGIVRRLVAKGYQAYVVIPQPGAPPVYRVQVGRFNSRSDADRAAARLRKEEQFKPWVTR